MPTKVSMAKRKCTRAPSASRPTIWFRFFLYVFLGAIVVLAGFLGYQYLLSPRVKRAQGKQGGQNLLGTQSRGSYDVDWIPKHHLNQSKTKTSRSKRILPPTFLRLQIVRHARARVNAKAARTTMQMEQMALEPLPPVKMTNKFFDVSRCACV